MAIMFYWMALANGVLDALRDALVVTAFGGAEQIPYLTVYAVLPASLTFVAVFAKFRCVLYTGPHTTAFGVVNADP